MRANLALSTFLTVLLVGAQADALVVPSSSTGANVPSVVLLLRSQAQSDAIMTKRSFDHADDRADDVLLLRRAALIHTSDDDAGPNPTHAHAHAHTVALAPRKYGGRIAAAGVAATGLLGYSSWCWYKVVKGKDCY